MNVEVDAFWRRLYAGDKFATEIEQIPQPQSRTILLQNIIDPLVTFAARFKHTIATILSMMPSSAAVERLFSHAKYFCDSANISAQSLNERLTISLLTRKLKIDENDTSVDHPVETVGACKKFIYKLVPHVLIQDYGTLIRFRLL